MIQANTKRVGIGKRLLTAAASLVMLATCAVTAMPVHAANTPVTGGTMTFNKYLVMDEDENVPNVTFEFSIAAGDAVVGGDGQVAVNAGVGAPTVNTAVFSPADTASAKNGLPSDTAGSVTSGKKYVEKTVTVNFSGVTFNAPGIYHYTITEKPSTASGISNDASNIRELYAYVEYTADYTALKVSYALQNGNVTNPSDNTKSTGFTNSYSTNDLTLRKTVEGNQGDRDKYFAFTVGVSNAEPGTVYTVDLTNADQNPMVDGSSQSNAGTLTATEAGTVSATYYLKHNQSIVIKGLTADTKYTITEDSYTSSGYSTNNKVDGTPSGETNTTGERTMGAAAHTVVFTNSKNGTVPTGILLDVAPYIVLVAVVGVGLVALLLSKKRRSR